MKRFLVVTLALAVFCLPMSADAATKKQDEQKKDEQKKDELMSSETFAGLNLRNIGPAIMSGRVVDFAVDPAKRNHFYVAVASGGVWKTINAGTTWTPVFDGEKSYSVGCITLDPKNSNVVWVGTGENNSQRSVSFGDGVYKSLDGGQTWKNMGLEKSEHIGMITIDPRNTDVVYVAAQGPLWSAGGDRGLYKTVDGGKTWKKVLEIGEYTGINEVLLDPRNPDVLYASSYQRFRRVWTLINGGPESAIYKSTDAGETWNKVSKGLPEVDLGKIGMCIPPSNPDTIYAIIEAAREKGGVFRSTDRGESWEKRSDYVSGSPQYYNELICDPVNEHRVYSMDTWMNVSQDGGKTFTKVGEENKHVDNHALWIDPDDTDYLLAGCDGGVYESFDRGVTWLFKENLPITQFYRVSVDESTPFYYVYGGTQDNNSLGGPSRTLDSSGISNEDYFITVGGDGYETVVDPTDPNIVYAMWQYGGLVRYDRRSGEIVDIQPQEEPGEAGHRWNWDSPILLSHHLHTRLYYANQRLYRTDDRGDTWTAISPDLSRQLDRNQLEVMGKLWSIDAVAKNISTSDFGNIVSLAESPRVEHLLYVGTDDGLIQITEDGGANWRKIESIKGVPEMTYVSRLEASLHDDDTVYAAFDNHKNGDFKPYLFVSRDRGRTWSSIVGDLPERDTVWVVLQDHVNPKLLFAGTEFGLYFTVDEGVHWIQLKGGLPTIAVRDLAIQQRENDLALGTFGRGFYIFDDYSALRSVNKELLEQSSVLFPVKDPWLFIEKTSRRGVRGHGFYTADNPPFGATFTYYLKDGLKTLEEIRIEAEKKADEEKEKLVIPSYDELQTEEWQVEPSIIFVIRDEDNKVVSRVSGDRKKGLHRVTWNLRQPTMSPTTLEPPEPNPWGRQDTGLLVSPGTYSVTMYSNSDGKFTTMAGPQKFTIKPLGLATLAATDREAVAVFQAKAQELYRAVSGALEALNENQERINYLRKALINTVNADPALMTEIENLNLKALKLRVDLKGDSTREDRNVFTAPSIVERIDRIRSDVWETTQAPTVTHQQAYEWAADAFTDALLRLNDLASSLDAVESTLEAAGAPWTPGRIPEWNRKK